MKIKRGHDGKWHAVFKNNVEAENYEWLFVGILRRTVACFGAYDNAYQLT